MKHTLLKGGLAALALSLTMGSAASETFEAKTFNDVISDSTACIKGTVSDISYETVGGATWTYTTFDVESVAFGPVGGSTVTVRTAGGPVSTATIPVVEVSSGSTRFFQGTSSILLLQQIDNSGTYNVTNSGQGVLSVSNDSVRLPYASRRSSAEEAIAIIRDIRSNGAGNVE